VLDALGMERVIVAGHHTGAAIAASFAARHGDRVSGLILHGTPLYNAGERAARLAAPDRPRTLSPDGAHLSDYYRYIRNYAGDHPRTALTANWSVLNWYLSGANDIAHEAVYRHDLEADLRAIAAPTLILSDARESLHANDVRARALRPDFRYHLFSDGGAHAMMLDPARWAEIAAAFVSETD
jgi:pimeloyl-ACP methyl ester carboxylesterase